MIHVPFSVNFALPQALCRKFNTSFSSSLSRHLRSQSTSTIVWRTLAMVTFDSRDSPINRAPWGRVCRHIELYWRLCIKGKSPSANNIDVVGIGCAMSSNDLKGGGLQMVVCAHPSYRRLWWTCKVSFVYEFKILVWMHTYVVTLPSNSATLIVP